MVFEANYTGWNELTRPTYDEIATKIDSEIMEVVNSAVLPNKRPIDQAESISNAVALAIRAQGIIE